MTYDKKTCRLESSTGYIKNLVPIYDEYPVMDHPIYVPNGAEVNYAEAAKEEYEAYLKAREEREKKAIADLDRQEGEEGRTA